jgi:hypothetical protein
VNYAQTNSTSPVERKLPVLIVAYCRASRITQLLEMLEDQDRRVYVAIDKAPATLTSENEKVRLCVESFKSRLNLVIQVNKTQAGVKLGVPQAIDWVMNYEESCIILEDDCTSSAESLDYFDRMSGYLKGNIALISGDSPWESAEVAHSSLSAYPLIWGWATNREQWQKLRTLIGGQIPWSEVIFSGLRKPTNILPISYFLSAQIRVNRGDLQAWDCSVALNMLLKNLKCVIPNVRIINNIGDDEFAHHTLDKIKLTRSQRINVKSVSTSLAIPRYAERATDMAIRKRIYKMKWQQVFSPLKALLGWK